MCPIVPLIFPIVRARADRRHPADRARRHDSVERETLIDRKEVEGLTVIASDPNEAEPGPIVVQETTDRFRKFTLTSLEKAGTRSANDAMSLSLMGLPR